MDIRQILVTTDFSENSRRVYSRAVGLARKFNAKLNLVHFSGVFPTVISGTSSEAHYETLEKALEHEATDSAFEKMDVVVHLERGRWTPERLRAIEKQYRIDMVVMGTHGRSGLQHFVLGSFAERLVRNSSVPVLVSRGSDVHAELNPKFIVVPYDFSEVSEAMIPAIRFFSLNFRCSFRFIYVYEPVPATHFPALQSVREFFERAPKGPIEDRFAELQHGDLSGISMTLETCQGIPPVEIVKRVQELEADLVLIGTHGVIGSVAQTVTRQAPCSVLTVPK